MKLKITDEKLDELKRVLCEFDEIEIHEQFNDYDKGCDFEGSEVDFTEGARNENAKSAAIISELIEIIQSQSEIIERTAKEMHSLVSKEYDPDYAFLYIDAENILSETTTRLQKLRDRNSNGK